MAALKSEALAKLQAEESSESEQFRTIHHKARTQST